MDAAESMPPLLSQDDFFRRLELRSVRGTPAKHHYREALKERLRRAAALRKAERETLELSSHCKQFAFVRWRSTSVIGNRPFPLHHPGIDNEHLQRRGRRTGDASMVEMRKGYLPENDLRIKVDSFDFTDDEALMTVLRSDDSKLHCISFRRQPGRRKIAEFAEEEEAKKKVNAATMLKRKSNLPLPAAAAAAAAAAAKITGTASVLRSRKTKVKRKPPPPPPKAEEKTTARPEHKGRFLLSETSVNLKVHDPKKFCSRMGTCETCGRRFKIPAGRDAAAVNVKSWKEALDGPRRRCGSCLKLLYGQHPGSAAGGTENGLGCDICNKMFGNKSNMVRHVVGYHAPNARKVELAKRTTGCGGNAWLEPASCRTLKAS